MALPETGPFLTAALLCERVLQEMDGTASIIRLLDRINVTAMPSAPGAAVPQAMPAVPMPQVTLFLSLKSGAARGRRKIAIQIEQPNGIKMPPQQTSVLLEGEDRGVNVITTLNLVLGIEGLYWFHISLDGEFLTSVPLRLVYLPQGGA